MYQIEVVGPVGESFNPNSSQILNVGMPAARYIAIYSKTRVSLNPYSHFKYSISPNHCEQLIACPMTADTAIQIDLN